jgi:8-oxo-dGTP pyrophosphatase MutT (NUDIX family)
MQRIFKNWRQYVVERVGEAHEKDTDQVGLVVVLDSQERALILKRSDEVGYAARRWSIPGGHIQEDESFEEGAARETKEETQLEVSNLEHIKSMDRLHFYVSHGFSGELEINFEHTDSAWVTYEDLDKYDIVKETKEILVNLLKGVSE